MQFSLLFCGLSRKNTPAKHGTVLNTSKNYFLSHQIFMSLAIDDKFGTNTTKNYIHFINMNLANFRF